MDHQNIVDMNFDKIVSLLDSDNMDKNTYLMIEKQFPKIIRKNFEYITEDSENEDVDEDELYEKSYERLVEFFKNLIVLKKLDLVKIGLKTFFNIEKENVVMLYDLAHTFFKNEMLKEYFEIVTEFNTNKYFVNEGLTEQIGDMFLDINPNKIYYLITETSIFSLKNRHYQLMKFIVDTWTNKNFDIKEMSTYDIEKTARTINLLNDAIRLNMKK